MKYSLLKFIFYPRYLLLSFIYLLIFNAVSSAQVRISAKRSSTITGEFALSYNIVVKGKKTDGIAETYNGGVKTVFVKGNKVRLRLVSLMRTQSIFFQAGAAADPVAAVVKESGSHKTKYYLSQKTWKIYNKKYDSVQCELFEDTLTILNRLCKKAVINVGQDKIITAYYYPAEKNKALSSAEPVFSCIPGLVMKYTYEVNEKSIEYTAVSISNKKLAPAVFIIPTKEYTLQRYRPGKPNVNVKDLSNDEEEGVADEE